MDLTTATSADPLATEGAPDARRMDLTTAAPLSPAPMLTVSLGKERPMRAEWT
jgi:hypothetical protein